MIKVFIYVLMDDGSIKTMDDRGNIETLSKYQYSRALKILKQLDFDDLRILVNVKKSHPDEKRWITIGTQIQAMIEFMDNEKDKKPYVNPYYWPDEDEYEILS